MQQLNIKQIEDGLLELPRYKELERGRESEELRRAAIVAASLYNANFWKLKAFTSYPDAILDSVIGKMEANDVIKENRVAESYARAFTKAQALIDRILGLGDVKAEVESPATVTNSEGAKSLLALMVKGATAVSHSGKPFSHEDVVEYLRREGFEHLGESRDAFTHAAREMVKAGKLAVVVQGRAGKPATYVLATAKPVASTEKTGTRTAFLKQAIQSRTKPFTVADLAKELGGDPVKDKGMAKYVIDSLIKTGQLRVAEARS